MESITEALGDNTGVDVAEFPPTNWGVREGVGEDWPLSMFVGDVTGVVS